MEIKDERNNKSELFENLFPGDVFAFEDRIFMRVETIEYGNDEDEYFNAVSVEEGNLFKFEENDSIIPLIVQLRILREG